MHVTSARFVLAVIIGVWAAAARAAELPIVAKARAYLGSEAALNAVQSIHHVGSLSTVDPKDPTKQVQASIEIILLKPRLQRITVKSDAIVETTALDDYEAWTRTSLTADPSKWQQTVLAPEAIKRLRANTLENLFFFRGAERSGGTIEDKGAVTMDGIACQKVLFSYAPGITFLRYFDVATGRVVLTETEAGTIREEGEMVVNGVRFPRKVTTSLRSPDGKTATMTVTFEKTTLNETFAPELFRMPALSKR